MKATKEGMKGYTIEQLSDYVERTDEKYRQAPAFIKRTSLARWKSNSAAICAEIQIRLMDSGCTYCTATEQCEECL
jgi:hypothetical protein